MRSILSALHNSFKRYVMDSFPGRVPSEVVMPAKPRNHNARKPIKYLQYGWGVDNRVGTSGSLFPGRVVTTNDGPLPLLEANPQLVIQPLHLFIADSACPWNVHSVVFVAHGFKRGPVGVFCIHCAPEYICGVENNNSPSFRYYLAVESFLKPQLGKEVGKRNRAAMISNNMVQIYIEFLRCGKSRSQVFLREVFGDITVN
mmetsp:Transcript_8933/g.39484  ORF Transcript_8933/g.39484 Transcript_8933/m.39484 type:complete len:201 (-) Transcript_8933:324-926(-)|eukprot:CAMPEP_0113965784 /NCGR_PEP_ID=MMETSP0011_2-20120614/7949_1 /TAXON_ID=101924 /ORGANISM="Rhodosorus marinus" /LENGTH=200 /DNA_ID=CAMNT_0000978359 /DNA_START=282 /DNA_END=884 /DNA_ORIENTATION=+ /assembly_acc=CAM_ASM_000156